MYGLFGPGAIDVWRQVIGGGVTTEGWAPVRRLAALVSRDSLGTSLRLRDPRIWPGRGPAFELDQLDSIARLAWLCARPRPIERADLWAALVCLDDRFRAAIEHELGPRKMRELHRNALVAVLGEATVSRLEARSAGPS